MVTLYEPEPERRVTLSAYERVPQAVARVTRGPPETVAVATSLDFADSCTFAFSDGGVRSVIVMAPSSGVPIVTVFEVPVFVKLPRTTDVVRFTQGVVMSVW